MKKYIYYLFLTLFLTGCEVFIKEDSVNDNKIVFQEENKRFELAKVQEFRDFSAYNSYRGIYILKDKNTNKEYIGISGVGIAEIGSHTTGKTTTTDER